MDSLGQRELYLGIVELLHLGSAAIQGFHDLHLDYLYGVGACAMTGAHIAVALRHCSANREVPVLPVHVVCTRSGIVPQPDPKVLDFHWCLLRNLKELIVFGYQTY
jgi:hypothetical protein